MVAEGRVELAQRKGLRLMKGAGDGDGDPQLGVLVGRKIGEDRSTRSSSDSPVTVAGTPPAGRSVGRSCFAWPGKFPSPSSRPGSPPLGDRDPAQGGRQSAAGTPPRGRRGRGGRGGFTRHTGRAGDPPGGEGRRCGQDSNQATRRAELTANLGVKWARSPPSRWEVRNRARLPAW